MASIFRDYLDVLIAAHRNVRLFFIATFLSQIGQGFFGILYNLYIKSMGLPDTVAGAYVAANSLASTLSLVPAGMISDRYGRSKSVLIATALLGCVMVGQVFVQVPWMIVLGAFLSGMFTSVIWVSVLPLLAENTAKEDRFHLFSMNFGLGLIAQVFGSMISGGLAQVFTAFLDPVWSLRLTLLFGALVMFTSLVPFSRIADPPRSPKTSAHSFKLSGALSRFKAQKSQLWLITKFAIASTLIGFGAGLVIPYLNLYFAERFHMTKAGIGIVIGLAQAVTALAMFVGPAMAKRMGPVKAAVSFQLASIPFLLTTAYANNALFASGAVIIRNALMNCANPIQDSIMMALVSEDLRGFAVSAGQTLWSLGWAVMGPVSTHIVHQFGSYNGYAIVFTATAILYLIGAIYYFIAFGKHEAEVVQE
ncbi:MFS transporter [Alicyclobacillus dauci]|uniref:MFS transporter n=1 Tax=Alicyclobacillus dauci TaxID=1475485 RepID=A0ABY6Z361_9BACL|nr:MFS transporter [Alicyclobacillus dauci]WAH37194.1 MFS transporter [Alicyclobacillus dauci]